MVQYGTEVGIGDTLVDAISDMAGSTPPPDQNPPSGGNQKPSKGDRAKARALLQQAQADFAAADQALAAGQRGAVGHAQPPGPGRGRQGPQPPGLTTSI